MKRRTPSQEEAPDCDRGKHAPAGPTSSGRGFSWSPCWDRASGRRVARYWAWPTHTRSEVHSSSRASAAAADSRCTSVRLKLGNSPRTSPAQHHASGDLYGQPVGPSRQMLGGNANRCMRLKGICSAGRAGKPCGGTACGTTRRHTHSRGSQGSCSEHMCSEHHHPTP